MVVRPRTEKRRARAPNSFCFGIVAFSFEHSNGAPSHRAQQSGYSQALASKFSRRLLSFKNAVVIHLLMVLYSLMEMIMTGGDSTFELNFNFSVLHPLPVSALVTARLQQLPLAHPKYSIQKLRL